jgi:hypothetical protein
MFKISVYSHHLPNTRMGAKQRPDWLCNTIAKDIKRGA